MTKFAFLFPALVLLAACGEEPAPAPVASAATPAPAPTSSLSAPDQAKFTAVFAAACPEAEPVNTASCRRAGFGATDVVCEYGLGEDSYLRDKATLTPNADSTDWVLGEAETVCKQHLEHHQG